MSKFKPGDRIRVARSVDHDDIQSLIGKTGTVVDRPISHGCPGTHVTLDLDGMADPKHELSVQEIELLADEVRVVNETTGGAKGSKPERFSLLPWDVLGKLAEHYGKGAKKYTRYGECNCNARAGSQGTPAACVEVATTNGLSDAIPNTLNGRGDQVPNGTQIIEPTSGNMTSNTGVADQGTRIAGRITALPSMNTTPTSPSPVGSAVRHPNTLTTTTAVASEGVASAFVEPFATDATSVSGISKAGSRKTEPRHSPGCPALTIISPGDHNWRKGYDWSLSIDALGRHLAAFIEGETYDPETGSHHMLAVMFHAAALVYFTDAFPQLDDRRNSKDGSANDADI